MHLAGGELEGAKHRQRLVHTGHGLDLAPIQRPPVADNAYKGPLLPLHEVHTEAHGFNLGHQGRYFGGSSCLFHHNYHGSLPRARSVGLLV